MTIDLCIFCSSKTHYNHARRNNIPIVCTHCTICDREYCITEEGYYHFTIPAIVKADTSWYIEYEKLRKNSHSRDMPVFGIDKLKLS